jgi:hypothetical protein|tara:strand:+ start:897 stop:1073 length:177 start_codon:yes stop_codon:yes gene_type:complete
MTVNSKGAVMTDQKHRNREKRIWRNTKNMEVASQQMDRLWEQYVRSEELVDKDLQEVL